MPDVHQGYGFPIGGVAATKMPDGVISPGGIGYDINCGVRLLSTKLASEEVQSHLKSNFTCQNTTYTLVLFSRAIFGGYHRWLEIQRAPVDLGFLSIAAYCFN